MKLITLFVMAVLICGCGQQGATVTPAAANASKDQASLVAAGGKKPADAAPAESGKPAEPSKPANPKLDKPAADPEQAVTDKPDKPDHAGQPGKANEPKKVVRSEEEWKKILTREQYYVLRQKGTERPYVNKYDEHFEPGIYACAGCGAELFTSKTKFNSGCGWPAFYAAAAGDRVKLLPDNSLGVRRTEVICARCDGHLGHIFDDAPQTPTGNRYCINSASLKFIPAPIRPDDAKKGEEPKKETPKEPVEPNK